MTRGTVQTAQLAPAPLTDPQVWEFAVALMQQAPRDLDPEKIKFYLANKSQLGLDLRSVLGKPLPDLDVDTWQKFYEKHFGMDLGTPIVHVPQKPGYPCRAVVVVPGVTNNAVFDACTKAFGGKTWRYERDLDTVTDIVKRPEGSYVVWVRDAIEADEDMQNKSANDIETTGINTLTLKERMLVELAYFDETGKHLDIANWTLCAGSRFSDGRVPCCGWHGDGFDVGWSYVGDRDSRLRARVVVS